jgi:hypothetical protein
MFSADITPRLTSRQIIGAPSFFPTVWSWIKRWFDPITVSKIFILSQADMLPTLSKYIATENIPKKYGGTLDFEWGARPNLDPAIQEALDWKVPGSNGSPPASIPRGPVRWRELPDGGVEAVAVGKVDGKKREEAWARSEVVLAHLHGVERHIQNTPVDWTKEEYATTDGTATQPKEDGDPEFGHPTVEGEQEVTKPVEPVLAADADKQVENEKAAEPEAPFEAKQPVEDVAGLDVITEKLSTMPIRTASDNPVPTLKGVTGENDPVTNPETTAKA